MATTTPSAALVPIAPVVTNTKRLPFLRRGGGARPNRMICTQTTQRSMRPTQANIRQGGCGLCFRPCFRGFGLVGA